MWQPEALQQWLKRLRREPLHASDGAVSVSYGQAEIECLLPHRAPFLLVDTIQSVSLTKQTLQGTLYLREDDPIFVGHFPGDPVYPGVMQIEAMGQLALCLSHFIASKEATVTPETKPRSVRATRVHHALYLEPVLPGFEAVLQAAMIEDDGLTAIAAGQLYQQGKLCSLSIQEVYLDEA
jgi:3-hydroxyacyl-[acyl-carrier-protein] dehydratase